MRKVDSTVTPEIYDSIYLRKLQNNFLNELDGLTIEDEEIASLKSTAFLAKRDLARYKKLIADNLQVTDGSNNRILLDLGCGLGRLGCWLAEQLDLRAVGVDFSPVAIKAARVLERHSNNTSSKARFKVADFAATGLQKSSVCAVVSFDALYLAPKPMAALREIRRILRPEGLLLFTTYSQSSETSSRYRFDWVSTLNNKGFQIIHYKEVTAAWQRQMQLKHKRRWNQRNRIKADLGPLGEAELDVSASMLGLNGRPSFLSKTCRFEILARIREEKTIIADKARLQY